MAQLGGGYKILKMLAELWEQLKILFGLVERKVHEEKNETIKEKTDVAGDPAKPVEDRLDAVEDLEDIANRHT